MKYKSATTTATISRVEELIEKSPPGKNTSFLKSSHNLWKRFNNYENYPPITLEIKREIVALIYATYSRRTKYTNLYDIVTVQEKEGNGYASSLWDLFLLDGCK